MEFVLIPLGLEVLKIPKIVIWHFPEASGVKELDFKELDFKELGVLGYLLGVLGYLLGVPI